MFLHSLRLVGRGLVLAVLLSSLTACSAFKKSPKYAGTDGDFVNGTPLADRQEGVSFLGGNVERNRFASVLFGFDSSTVAPSETGKLQEVAAFMKGERGQLIIAGFTDERGTAEYNRGLGEKRAQTVRSWLIAHGADAGRIQTTSYGLDMPVDPGHNEAAWAKNRRAEFGVVK